ncbi:MAG: hypothetical protein KDB11_07640 [Planctomycetales bacterium]|nr:hypothetical protein [Planctomycetales bacterium]
MNATNALAALNSCSGFNYLRCIVTAGVHRGLQRVYTEHMKSAHFFATFCLLTGVTIVHADYRETILNDEPMVWWSFDESHGAMASDQTGNIVGNYVSVANRRGVRGLAANFTGPKAARIEFAFDQPTDTRIDGVLNGSFSLELWLLDDAAAPDGKTNYSIIYKADAKVFTRNSMWLYRARQDGHYHFRIQDKQDRKVQPTAANPAGKAAGDATWHHLVVVVDRDQLSRCWKVQGGNRLLSPMQQLPQQLFRSGCVSPRDERVCRGRDFVWPGRGRRDEFRALGDGSNWLYARVGQQSESRDQGLSTDIQELSEERPRELVLLALAKQGRDHRHSRRRQVRISRVGPSAGRALFSQRCSDTFHLTTNTQRHNAAWSISECCGKLSRIMLRSKVERD